jgi:hypothetical protein
MANRRQGTNEGNRQTSEIGRRPITDEEDSSLGTRNTNR